ncbi:MAG: methyl-accepting chemotaxis protein [Steroidobacteraceae bacterium]|nr:methyl-accepting chemotaxis protein [Steroidobacteraceae bacterium]
MRDATPTRVPYLTRLRCNADRLLLGVVGSLLLLAFALAPWHGTWSEALSIGVPAAAMVAWRVLAHPGTLLTRCVVAAALMVMTALHIHQARGMIELHFGVFVLLAFLLVYRDWIPVVVAAGVIAVHHLAFDWLQRGGAPVWTFAADTGFAIVLVHAAYVVFETALLVVIALRLRAESEAIGGDPRELSDVAQRIARGDLDTVVHADGATGDSLAVAMQRMRDALADTARRAAAALDAIARGDLAPGAAQDGSAIGAGVERARATLREVVRDASDVMSGIAEGDLSRRVRAAAPGEFASLREHVNATAEFLARFDRGQRELIRRANAGDFSGRIDTQGLAGYQLELASGINDLVRSFDAFVDRFGTVMAGFAGGEFERGIDAPAAGRLEALRQDTNSTAARLSQIVGRIRAAAAGTDAAAESVASTNAELARRSREQARAVESTASALEQITSTVRQNTDRTRLADELARGTAEVAGSGRTVAGQAVERMRGIRESSTRVSSIVELIEGIAFQTNLLALNAAVEAARAGAHGRGFAVVASEVRTLAERSASAAKEISQLIQDSVERVESGSELVDQAGAAMARMVERIGQITTIVGEIAGASGEQSRALDAVAGAMNQIDSTTKEIAQLVADADRAAVGLRGQADSLTEATRLLSAGQPQAAARPPQAESRASAAA